MHLARRFPLAVLPLLLLPVLETQVPGQDYRQVKIDSVGLEITISSRLKPLPLKLDNRDPNHKARFRPDNAKDYVQTRQGRAPWYTDIYEFRGQATTPTPTPTPPRGSGRDDGEVKESKLPPMQTGAKSFEEFLGKKQGLEFITKGKPRKKRGKFLAYKLWEYLTRSRGMLWYTAAAVYSFPEREVALVVTMPVIKDKRPTGKFKKFLDRQIRSGRALKASAGPETETKRDKYADSDKKKAALEQAKKNIQGLPRWDYFTTKSYIAIYSWQKGGRISSLNLARHLSSRLEKMRKLYEQHYPPSQGMEMPYSVFRICATYKQFMKYGGTRGGVVGWFSPVSKELVVFKGGDKLMYKGATETVTFHEGWHQYCNAYFSGATVHRWFDEGTGDFFGSHQRRGSKWYYAGSKMRYKSVKQMVRKGDYVPFGEIVKWSKRRFYTGRPAYYYAQAYGMVDFLRRGAVLKKIWDPAWANILDTYRKVVLETKRRRRAPLPSTASTSKRWRRPSRPGRTVHTSGSRNEAP